MIKTATDYHFSTSYDRYDMKGHFLDWENQPNVYKAYPGIEAIPLPKVTDFPKSSLREVARMQIDLSDTARLDFNCLSQIFSLSYSLTARSRHGAEHFYYRSAASAGALYPNEIYLGAYDIDNLQPGLYHYGIGNADLTPLRIGNFSRFTAAATGLAAALEPAATFFITGIFFRSAWKYRARAFRYVLLDAGHVLENLLLALRANGLGYTVHYNFDDEKLGELIGLDPKKEVCLACVNVTCANVKGTPSTQSHPNGTIDRLSYEIIEASRVSKKEIVYDEIQQTYRAGIPVDRDPNFEMIQQFGITPKTWIPIQADKDSESVMGYPEAVFSRRSKRNYVDKDLSQKKFLNLLELVCIELTQDASFEPGTLSSMTTGFLAGNVEGVAPGFYLLNPQQREAGLVREGPFIEKMTPVCLNQDWLYNASLHFVFMTSLSILDACRGPRGYRYAMMNAGCLGQAVYLGATALGLGCCGIGAFYDGEARDLLGLNNESVMLYLVAAGPVKRL